MPSSLFVWNSVRHMGYLDDLMHRSKKQTGIAEMPKFEEEITQPPNLDKSQSPTHLEHPTLDNQPNIQPIPSKEKKVTIPLQKPIVEEPPQAKQQVEEIRPPPIDDGNVPDGAEFIAESGMAKIYKINNKKKYFVPVPRPSGPEREILDTVKEAATRLITVTPEEITNVQERRAFFKKRILEIIDASPELGIAPSKIDFYADTIVREMIGYGPLDLLLADDQLEEIMVIAPNKPVYVFHRHHEMLSTNVVFGRDDDIRGIIDRVARDVGKNMTDYMVIITKSTVPIGTAKKVKAAVQEELTKRGVDIPFDVASNPEFLREGFAVDDFMKPDRIVIGAENNKALDKLEELYEPFVRQGNPIIRMNTESSEVTKYAANSYLAMRITYMNELANFCEKVGANVDLVRKGMGTDDRIGKRFLFSGIGYGGSCFPKLTLLKIYLPSGLCTPSVVSMILLRVPEGLTVVTFLGL